MCFSPAASLIAGGGLSVAGAYSLKYAKKESQLAFAAIPLIFGVQQIIEGFVWLTFDKPYLHSAATYAFVMFSHVFWPAFLPFAVWRLEPEGRRKRWLGAFVWLGGSIGATMFAFVMHGPVTSSVVGNCIAYAVPLPNLPYGFLPYLVATCGSCFLSSKRFVRIFGYTLFGSLGIALWSYHEAFYSVWCFFAAILSLIVFIHLRQESGEGT